MARSLAIEQHDDRHSSSFTFQHISRLIMIYVHDCMYNEQLGTGRKCFHRKYVDAFDLTRCRVCLVRDLITLSRSASITHDVSR